MKNDAKTSETNIWTILLVVFVVLKLTHTIEWKWIWVLSPLWIPIAIVIVAAIIINSISVISQALKK